MNEKRHDLFIGPGATVAMGDSWTTNAGVRARVTKDENREILAQCQKIEAEPEERAWRPGDVILHKTTDTLWIRGKYRWTCVDKDCNPAPDDAMATKEDAYRMNLLDILAQGEIVVSFTGDELTKWEQSEGLLVRVKLTTALSAYRQRKESK